MSKLTLTCNGFKLTTIEKPTVIGRGAQADLRLVGSQSVSRRHAGLYREAGHWYVLDLCSLNGTFLNGTKLGNNPKLLEDGDVLKMGRYELRVRFDLPQVMEDSRSLASSD